MLLIALGEREEFELPVAKVATYYGVSAETASRGFDELVLAGLIRFDQRWITDARLAPLFAPAPAAEPHGGRSRRSGEHPER